ncbi:MAG: DUF4350 domain-containing protein [Demequinaceae bacterium]|nr:DUF4350 domain-containing protein [Demequinaceae bacterium]
MTASATSQGFTVADAPPGLRSRAGRVRWWWIPIGLLAVLIIAISVIKPTEDFAATSIRNYQPEGARALAQVASTQGVALRQIHALGDARIADPGNTTVVIASSGLLDDRQIDSITDYPGDVVILDSSPELLTRFAPQVFSTATETFVFDAECQDADAATAGSISTEGNTFVGPLPDDAIGCFSSDADHHAMIIINRDGRSLTLLASPSLVTNAHIAEHGNAALTLRLIGKHPTAVWYLNDKYDTSTLTWLDPTHRGNVPDPSPSLEFFPPGTGTAVLSLFLSLIAVALWRARRFGPLVTEPLPVVIRSSEATAGRARLYRASGAYGRASASLRAGAAARMGKRLGIPRSSDQEHLVSAIVRATGRASAEITAVLYGPPPSSESAMMELVARIDTIEDEVHRP